MPLTSTVKGLVLKISYKDGASKGLRNTRADVTSIGKAATSAAKEMGSATAKLQTEAQRAASQLKQAYGIVGVRSMKDIKREIDRTNAAYRRLAKSGTLSASEQQRAMTSTKAKVRELKQEMGSATRSMSGFAESAKRLLAVGGIVIGLSAIKEAITAVADAGQQYQAIMSKLQFATGNAGNTMHWLRGEASALGLDLQRTAQDFGSFAAATKGTAIEGKISRDIMHGLALASTALHLRTDQTSGALKAMEQMMSKGTVQAEELRGQLGERIPGAFKMAADAMGVTTAELNKMLQQGQVLSTDLLPKLAKEFVKRFGEQAAKATHNLTQEVNRLSNGMFALKTSIFSSGVGEALTWLTRKEADGAEGLAILINHMSGAKDATSLALRIVDLTAKISDLKRNLTAATSGHRGFIGTVFGDDPKNIQLDITNLQAIMTDLYRQRNALLAPVGASTSNSWLKALTADAKAASSQIDQLVKAMQTQVQKDTSLRSKVFGALGSAASSGLKGSIFAGQVQDLKSEISSMLQAGIGQQDVSAYMKKQLDTMRGAALKAGTSYQSDSLNALAQSSQTMVQTMAGQLEKANGSTRRLDGQLRSAADAAQKFAVQAMRIMPAKQAGEIASRMDTIIGKFRAIGNNSNITTRVATEQALQEVSALETAIQQLTRPRTINVSVAMTQAVANAGSVNPFAAVGSRATGGMINRDGMYYMHAGEQVISNNSQSFRDINIVTQGGMPGDRAGMRALVRQVLLPEIAAASR